MSVPEPPPRVEPSIAPSVQCEQWTAWRSRAPGSVGRDWQRLPAGANLAPWTPQTACRTDSPIGTRSSGRSVREAWQPSISRATSATVASRRHDRRGVDSLVARAIADADTLRPTGHEAVYLAWMYAETGQRERALAVLERFARPRHLHFQLHLLREFALDSLRREPRFKGLLRSDSTRRLR
jgi:hypothetical protein